MSYTVLARRYRSRGFDELIGQEPIARTLQNAIASDRTAHAYLFTGTRGVGKTSMARIFAYALNVTADLEEAEGITEAIFRGDDLDVIEIDGASYRGINEARELIAGAGLSPARCRYRIYIIDEVHQLTKDAFNALLKTMEEPPAHVKFILCTTEPHKVPATIQSRCQRFDFRPVTAPRIAAHLGAILEQEQIEADEEVLSRIAQLGRGSVRDALSLLDRVLACGEKRLTMTLLEEILGIPDQTLVINLVDAMIAADPGQALQAAQELLMSGTSLEQTLELLIEHFRGLMLVCTCGPETELLESGGELRAALTRQSAAFDAAGLVHMIALCDSVSRNARGSSTARALFDAAVVRLCLSSQLVDSATVLRGGGSVVESKPAAPKKKEDRLSPPPTPPEPPQAVVPPSVPEAPVAVSKAVSSAGGPTPVATPPSSSPSVSPASGAAIWEAVREYARDSKTNSDWARVEHLELRSMVDRTMHFVVDDAGQEMAGFLSKQTSQLADLIERATGKKMLVRIELPEGPTPSAPVAKHTDAFDSVRQLEPVARALEVFDATIVDVKQLQPAEEAMTVEDKTRV